MNKVNYPVVYTVKPIASLNWRNYGRVIGYAVVESYLISEIKRYDVDGNYEYLYEVVYSWNEYEMNNVIPQFNRSTASDSVYTKNIFKYLESAQKYREICNNSYINDNGVEAKNNIDYVLDMENKHLSKHKVKSKLI